MPTLIHRRVEECRAGAYPLVLGRLASGWLVAGERQVVRGYCLLLPDPVVPHLNALEGASRRQFLEDLARVGDGLLGVLDCARINYEMLGNLEPALHAHLFPRYESEAPELKTQPIWFYDWASARPFHREEDGAWVQDLQRALGLA